MLEPFDVEVVSHGAGSLVPAEGLLAAGTGVVVDLAVVHAEGDQAAAVVAPASTLGRNTSRTYLFSKCTIQCTTVVP